MQICRVLHIREAISPFMFFSFYVTKNKKKISLGSARKSFTTNAQSAQMGNTPWQNFYFMFRLSKWPWLHMHLILERIFTSALVKKIELESCILITLTTISFPIYTYDFLWLKKKLDIFTTSTVLHDIEYNKINMIKTHFILQYASYITLICCFIINYICRTRNT